MDRSWEFEGAVITTSSAKKPEAISYANPGTFAIKLIIANAFTTTSITKTITVEEDIVSAVEGENISRVSVFPTVTRDFFNIETTEGNIDEVKIFDSLSRLFTAKSQDGSRFNISDLSAGIYMVKFNHFGRWVTFKVIKK